MVLLSCCRCQVWGWNYRGTIGGCPRGMRQKPHTAARTPPLPRGPLQGIERKGDRVALQRIFIKGGGAYETCFRRSSSLYENNHAARGYLLFFQFLAVRGGFEPPEPLRVRQFSKLLVSATHPSHRVGSAKVVIFY